MGKTTLIDIFSKSFENYIYLNLERQADISLFEHTDDITQIVNAAFLLKNKALKKGNTLIFIDEIQASPKAIQLLRYFYEDRPEIYVIAAGSLLEFALAQVASFPVGRVEFLCVHPLDFEEYLWAMGYDAAADLLTQIPIPAYAEEVLLRHFNEYIIVGGMPEVVKTYAERRNMAVLGRIYDRIWQSYKDDVEKYARNETDRKIIRHVINAAPLEKDRIKFEGFGNSIYRSREVGEALRALDMARVVQLIYPTTSQEPPIVADMKKRPRLQLLDTGLLNNAIGLQGEMIGIADLSDFYKGKIVQHIVAQELIAIHDQPGYKPNFWVRENPNSSAEVDLVYQFGQYVVPIEVKSGEQGRLRSLHQFIESSDVGFGLRFYGGAFKVESHHTPYGKPYQLINMPYFLGAKIPEYIGWVLKEVVKVG